MVGGGRPLILCKILGQIDPSSLFENADFRSIFAGSTSAVIPREKSLIVTNRKSIMLLPVSIR